MTPLVQQWPADRARLYRDQGCWRGETFSELLRRQAEARPNATAVVGGDQRWTYAELLRRAETAAAGFLALGLSPGERVVVHLPNLPEFLAVIFGLFRAGLVPVYALPAHRLTEIAHFARKAEASAYVTTDRFEGFDYRDLARQLQAEVPAVRHVVVVGEAGPFAAFEEFRPDPDRLPPEDAEPSSVAFLQISGGSTGL